MIVPIWLLVALGLLSVLSVLLAYVLWSSRTQRDVVIESLDVGPFPDVVNALEGLVSGWFVEGNDVEILQNGDGFFPALLRDIEGATRFVHLESYVWWTGDICGRLSEALARQAERGIEVRLLLDAMGARPMDQSLAERMTEAGVSLHFYHDFRFRTLGRLNKRDHRKLAVIDGRIAFVFSHGIAEQWEGRGDSADSWRDTGARLIGPVVGRIQSVFLENWMEESEEVLSDDRYFPTVDPAGSVAVQVVSSSPRGGISNVSLLFRLVVAAAREELLIQNSYFAPDHDMVDLLVAAVRRGVRVRVMVPGAVTDSLLTLHAGHYQFARLLEAGVEIYQHQLTLVHQKVLVVDRLWCHLGSTNFDERSFDINAEISLGILDRGVSEELRHAFEDDLEQCEPIEPDAWVRRSLRHRIVDWACFLVHEQI